MATVSRWTGREARLLREAMRMSVRGFASHLGYNDAAVSNWERRGEKTRLRTQTQRDLDTALKLADDGAQERFAVALVSAPLPAAPTPKRAAGAGRSGSVVELAVLGQLGMSTPSSENMGAVQGLAMSLDGHDGPGWDRATILRALLGVTLPLLPPSPPTASEAGEMHVNDPTAYAQATSCYQQLYWTTSGPALLQAAYSHTRLGINLARQATGSQRSTIASALAQSALLTARLALFDLARPTVASNCLGIALTAARSAEDPVLTAAVIGHLAFALAHARQPDDACCLTDHALGQDGHGAHPLVTSWLHCVASEVHARAGTGTTSLRHIDSAHAAFTSDDIPPAWFDFFDRARLHAFAGYAALAVGEHRHAATCLTQALDDLGPTGRKQRSVVLADLAAANAADGDLVANYLNQALDVLHPDPYTTGLDRIRAVRPLLGDSSHGKQIDQRIAAITADRPTPAGQPAVRL
jgi:hypothetical protein